MQASARLRIATDVFVSTLLAHRSIRMRPLILAIAIAGLFAGPAALAHGRHGGNGHAASLGKSTAQSGFSTGTALADNGSKPDARSGTDAAQAAAEVNAGKAAHHKSGRAPDEEEVEQPEH
jgi:hypothetical protein